MSATRQAARRVVVALPALLCAGAAAILLLAPPASADTQWGDTGAVYSGGITCRLPDGTVVPMARWDVDGSPAFATADIAATGGPNTTYGSAPTTAAPAPIQPGDAGLDSSDIATAAYLIDHDTRTPAQVAEVSADLAALAGGGALQSRCLGQQGTSRTQATALLAQAQRFAGPYTVALNLPAHPRPGTPVTVAAQVTSARGYPTPGVTVTFGANGASTQAATGRDGTAHARIVTPGARTTPIVASIAEPVSLAYYATGPGAVITAAPAPVSDTASLAAMLHPTPHVAVQSPGLVLHGTTITPHAIVTGTYGYSGTGTITVLGPLHPAGDAGCSTLAAAGWAKAPAAWRSTFAFTGDGTHSAGTTPALAAGCYAVTAEVTTTDSAPAVHASAGDGATLTVSALDLHESVGPGVVGPGGLAASVQATGAAGAQVHSTITVRGPLTPVGGSCSHGLDWARSPIAAQSDATRLTPSGAATTAPQDLTATQVTTPAATPAATSPAATTDGVDTTDAVGATITTPGVDRVGCYALSSRSTVTQDGRSIDVTPPVGGAGTTTLLAAPSLSIADGGYDGQVGTPMTGTITVVGSFHFPGTLHVGLVSAPRTDMGCRDVVFPHGATAVQSGVVVTSATTGDGTVSFRTPPPAKNLCYAVTATLQLTANPTVQARSPQPATSSVFLAGAVVRTPTLTGMPGGAGDTLRQAALIGGIALGGILGVALTVMVGAFVRRTPTR